MLQYRIYIKRKKLFHFFTRTKNSSHFIPYPMKRRDFYSFTSIFESFCEFSLLASLNLSLSLSVSLFLCPLLSHSFLYDPCLLFNFIRVVCVQFSFRHYSRCRWKNRWKWRETVPPPKLWTLGDPTFLCPIKSFVTVNCLFPASFLNRKEASNATENERREQKDIKKINKRICRKYLPEIALLGACSFLYWEETFSLCLV